MQNYHCDISVFHTCNSLYNVLCSLLCNTGIISRDGKTIKFCHFMVYYMLCVIKAELYNYLQDRDNSQVLVYSRLKKKKKTIISISSHYVRNKLPMK